MEILGRIKKDQTLSWGETVCKEDRLARCQELVTDWFVGSYMATVKKDPDSDYYMILYQKSLGTGLAGIVDKNGAIHRGNAEEIDYEPATLLINA